MVEKDMISVIMSCYNEKLDWIKESVESILSQDCGPLEFIIVLDKPDNLAMKGLLEAYGESDPRIRLLVNEENKGLVKSLNRALAYCSGRYVARMDADDISAEDRLEKQKTYLEDKGLDFIFSGAKVMDEDGRLSHESNADELSPNKLKGLLEVMSVGYHPTWFVRADLYRDLGGYREVSYCEDYDFLLRALAGGYRIGKMNGNVLRYRLRRGGISKSHALEQFLNARGIARAYGDNSLDDLDRVEAILQKTSQLASDKARAAFARGEDYYRQAVVFWQAKRRLRSLAKMALSCTASRYYFFRYMDVFRYRRRQGS